MRPTNFILNSYEIFVDAELCRDEDTFSFSRRGQSVSEPDKSHILEVLSDKLQRLNSLELGNLNYYRRRDLPKILVNSNEQVHLHKITCD